MAERTDLELRITNDEFSTIDPMGGGRDVAAHSWVMTRSLWMKPSRLGEARTTATPVVRSISWTRSEWSELLVIWPLRSCIC
jgi:hypothetical protein